MYLIKVAIIISVRRESLRQVGQPADVLRPHATAAAQHGGARLDPLRGVRAVGLGGDVTLGVVLGAAGDARQLLLAAREPARRGLAEAVGVAACA